MDYVIPVMLLLLVVLSLFKGVSVYESFVRGAKNALSTVISVLPYMATMMAALNIFRSSGALNALVGLISPAMASVGIPGELTPMIVLRPFSGGAALALLEDVYKNYGVDSYVGTMASIMLGSTETIFYTVALYFGAIGIKKTRHTVPTALISGLAGVAASVVITQLFFGR